MNRSSSGHVQGCGRLLPSTGPTMLIDTFPILLDGSPAPRSDQIWGSSRFALDILRMHAKQGEGLLSPLTSCLRV
ncbi:acyl-homoserine-lactone synthase [Bradyrhizobium ottawaense]|uniref:acyl-homoserine-lactone synthase n=1 Tax=Bradyrhizobium ottawaense TaxID=931866 RepID=UPI003D31C0CE